jgi:hypothetical protein
MDYFDTYRNGYCSARLIRSKADLLEVAPHTTIDAVMDECATLRVALEGSDAK